MTRDLSRILMRGGYVHTPADPFATALLVENGPTKHVRLPHQLIERDSTARPAPIKDLA